jgi:predicted transcriptional regulator
MSVPCEIAVKCVLPSIRAMTAKKLMTKHNLKQEDVAKLLGISQPAISLYRRRIRGKAIDLESDPAIMTLVEDLAASLAQRNMSRRDFIRSFCEICKTVRAKGLLCKLHKAFDPLINIEKCELCKTTSMLKCI